MTTEKAYLVGTHCYAYKAGEAGEIVGVEMVSSKTMEPRLCFKIRYQDGSEDFTPVFVPGTTKKNPDYEIVAAHELEAGLLSAVTR